MQTEVCVPLLLFPFNELIITEVAANFSRVAGFF